MHTIVGACGVGCIVVAEVSGIDSGIIRGLMFAAGAVTIGWSIAGLVEDFTKWWKA